MLADYPALNFLCSLHGMYHTPDKNHALDLEAGFDGDQLLNLRLKRSSV